MEWLEQLLVAAKATTDWQGWLKGCIHIQPGPGILAVSSKMMGDEVISLYLDGASVIASKYK